METNVVDITVRFFAVARELLGMEVMPVALPSGATLADLESTLHAAYPMLKTLRTRLAVNLRYVGPDYALQPGDEVACIPPVGGG